MDWDPTAGRVGLDWPVIRQGAFQLDHPLRAAGAVVPSTAAETISQVSGYFSRVSGDPAIMVEVYDPATTPGASVTSTYQPNEDVAFPTPGTGTWAGSPTNTAGNRYTNVDETTAAASDYLLHTAGSTVADHDASWSFRINTTADPFGVGNHTVSALRVRVAASFMSSYYSLHVLRLFYTAGGVDYEIPSAVSVAPSYTTISSQTYTFTLATNPATGLSFTEAEIAALDASTSFKLTSRIHPYSASITATTKIEWVSVEVEHRPQPVLASSAPLTITSSGWWAFTLSSNWSKADATDYVVVFRRTSSSGSATMPSLDSGEVSPINHRSMHPTVDAAGAVSDFGDEYTAAFPVGFIQSSLADSVDGQPYVALRRERVDVNKTVVQEITRPSTATVGWLRIVAASNTSQIPSAPLLAKIKNGAGTQQGGTATFGSHLVEDAPRTLRALDTTMASAVSLANATQYDVELTSAAPAGLGWVVSVLEAATPAVGFGGTTDRGEIDATESDFLDVAVVQGTVPAAPAGFTATANTAGEGSIDLAWTASALGADFDRYELERLDPDGATWRVIAHINTEATDDYVDEAARRGTVEEYRITVRHANGTVSAASTTDTATLTKTGTYLVSPANPSLSHRIVVVGDAITSSRPLDRADTYRYGSDYLSVTKGRRRGRSLSFTVLLDEGPDSYASQDDWVRDLEDADDLALVNSLGERWFVEIAAPSGSSLTPAVHLLPMTVVETRATQVIVEA